MNQPSLDGAAIARLGRVGAGLSDRLLEGVGPERFARQPEAAAGGRIACNHPAFIFGHLALYPPRMLEMLGAAPEPAAPEGFEARFAAGIPCRDDPEGRLYPGMDAILGAFRDGYGALLETLPAVPDERLAAGNPHEALRERLGLATVGEACAFMLTGHVQFHLGQLSTWRRAMGLGPVM